MFWLIVTVPLTASMDIKLLIGNSYLPELIVLVPIIDNFIETFNGLIDASP